MTRNARQATRAVASFWRRSVSTKLRRKESRIPTLMTRSEPVPTTARWLRSNDNKTSKATPGRTGSSEASATLETQLASPSKT